MPSAPAENPALNSEIVLLVAGNLRMSREEVLACASSETARAQLRQRITSDPSWPERYRSLNISSEADLDTQLADLDSNARKGWFRRYLVDPAVTAVTLPFKIADLPFKGVDYVAGRTVGNITRVVAITALLWYFLGGRARDMADFIVNAGGEAQEVAGAVDAVTPVTGITTPGAVVTSPGTGILPTDISLPGTSGNVIPD